MKTMRRTHIAKSSNIVGLPQAYITITIQIPDLSIYLLYSFRICHSSTQTYAILSP